MAGLYDDEMRGGGISQVVNVVGESGSIVDTSLKN